jgi:uncharacterized protein
MRTAEIAEADIETIVWKNPVAIFGQSGQLDLGQDGERPRVDQTELWEGNSVLRGQQSVVAAD